MDKQAANDAQFRPPEPMDGDIYQYASALAESVKNNAQVHAAMEKSAKTKLGFLGDGRNWSQDKIAQFDELITIAYLFIAENNLRKGLRFEDLDDAMKITHIEAALTAAKRCEREKSSGMGRP